MLFQVAMLLLLQAVAVGALGIVSQSGIFYELNCEYNVLKCVKPNFFCFVLYVFGARANRRLFDILFFLSFLNLSK